MLRDLTTLNPFTSRNQRSISLEMVNISGGAPITIWMENLMACTWTTHPIKNIMNGKKKNRVRENPTKGQVPFYKG